jgi:DNA-binding MarR family transcriptional regulator
MKPLPGAETETQRLLRRWQEGRPRDRLAHLVKDTMRAFDRALHARLARHGVSIGHWPFLRALWETDGLSQSELSREAGVMEPTTFVALKAMEARGYVVRRPVLGDRRKKQVFLTPRGRALERKLVPLAVAINATAVKGVSVRRVAATRRTLVAILANLAADEAREAARPQRGASARR